MVSSTKVSLKVLQGGEQILTEQEWLDIFGDNLLEMMCEYGINQGDLAEESGLSEATISKYLNKKQLPGIKAIVNIATVLECSIDDLVYFGDRII